MSREDYLRLAGEGLRMPIGADLVLRQHADGEAIMLDGARLGAVVAEAARGFRTPIALPLMDLTVEKAGLLQGLGVPAEQMDSCHFERCPEDAAVGRAVSSFESAPHPRVKAGLEAIRFVAAQGDLIPIGMAIGPFSLTTKLIADPITPVFLAGTGVTGGEDEEGRSAPRPWATVRVPDRLLLQDRHLCLQIRGLDVGDQSRLKAGAQTIFDPPSHWADGRWRRRSADDSCILVECVEELLLGAFLAHQKLDIVHQEDIDVAVLFAETGHLIVPRIDHSLVNFSPDR